MAKRVYLSNVSAIWSVDRQTEVLTAKLPGYPKGYVLFEDELDTRRRRLTSAKVLTSRNEMLRATTRGKQGEAIYVASLAVFAMSMDDMMQALTLAGARGAAVFFLHEGIEVQPATGSEVLHQVAVQFAEIRRTQKVVGAGRISADRRIEEAKRKVEIIKARWPLPSVDYPTAALLAEASLTLNTAKVYMGTRPDAQREHRVKLMADQKRATARAKRKEKSDQ